MSPLPPAGRRQRLDADDVIPFQVPNRPGNYRMACPRCAKGRRDTALSVTLEPGGKVIWHCFRECGESGARSEQADRISLPRRPGRRSGEPPLRKIDPINIKPTGNLEAALRLYREARPITGDNIATAYLAARGLQSPHPEADLRWHPSCWHSPGYTGAALVALITDVLDAGRAMTVHRTWIRPDGTKATVEPARRLWPDLPKKGGCIRLTPDCEITNMLAVCEGIETSLSVIDAGYPCFAMVDAGNLGSLPVLAGIESLLVVADHDPAGLKAADACAERWARAGAEVKVWKAPDQGQDANDITRAVA